MNKTGWLLVSRFNDVPNCLSGFLTLVRVIREASASNNIGDITLEVSMRVHIGGTEYGVLRLIPQNIGRKSETTESELNSS
jgi:hypothetical protein